MVLFFSIVLFDSDDCTTIDNTSGHKGGDAVPREAAKGTKKLKFSKTITLTTKIVNLGLSLSSWRFSGETNSNIKEYYGNEK
jgi:hypothetical protein